MKMSHPNPITLLGITISYISHGLKPALIGGYLLGQLLFNEGPQRW